MRVPRRVCAIAAPVLAAGLLAGCASTVAGTARFAGLGSDGATVSAAQLDGLFPDAGAVADLARTELLILDDWGTGSLDPAMRSDLLEIIDDRAGERATVLTHQLPVEHWHGWIGDATIADAILDRLMQRVHRFTLEGPSRRTAARPAKARPKADPAAAGTRTREDER